MDYVLKIGFSNKVYAFNDTSVCGFSNQNWITQIRE